MVTATDLAPLLRGRVGIDGPDAAGKTTLADALAALTGLPRVRADDFLAPPEVRYARGPLDPDGYYADAFDLAALRAAVAAHDTVIADGVFLFRPELNDLWDLRIYLHVDPEEQLRRVLARDTPRHGAQTRERYEKRYRPAYDAYRNAVRPHEIADVLG